MKNNQSFAIMQPFFFPYLGYFSLIKQTTNWIVFDDIRYSNQAWGNRNRVLKHPEGWAWITVPVMEHKRETFYSDILIQNKIDWKRKIINQLEYYKLNAPFYKDVIEVLHDIFAEDFTHLVDLNIHALEKVCEYLNIDFNHTRFSEINLGITSVEHPGQWAVEICKSVGVKTYVNPCEGHPIYRPNDFINAGIDLKFLINKIAPYNQGRTEFEGRLSIIDALMWNNVEEVNKLIDFTHDCNGECLAPELDEVVCEYKKFGIKTRPAKATDTDQGNP